MKVFSLIAILLLTQVMPKNNPNGIWRAETGSEFELKLVGSDVQVTIVPGSNPRFLEYSVDLKGTEEVNTYKGTGRFKARLEGGKECEFDTTWEVVVVNEETVFGQVATVVPDPDTCEVVDRGFATIELKRLQ